MVESKISCNHEVLQVIKNLELIPFENLNQVYHSDKKETDDPVLLFALYSRLKDICVSRNLKSMCAPFCGFHMDFFIYSTDGKNFIGIYDCDYEGTGNYYPNVVSCPNYFDESGKLRRFLCEKYTKIRVNGKILMHEKEITISEINKDMSGLEALLIQIECDNIDGNFVVYSGIEVEISNYAS